MARKLVHHPPGFAGGINYRDVPELVQPDQLLNGENMILDERGGGTKRLGTTAHSTVGAAGVRMLSMFVWYRVGGLAPQVVVHLSDGSVRYTTDLINWSTIWTGLSATAPLCFEAGFGGGAHRLYASNGVDDYRHWDGTTTGTIPSAPRGKYLRWWKDAMWVSGQTDPHMVSSSGAGDANTFPVANYVRISVGDGDVTKGLWGGDNYLQVFKNRRRFIIADPVTYENRLIDPDNGLESHFSLVAMRDEVYYLSRKGFCLMNPNGPAEVVSDLIKPIFKDALGVLRFEQAWGYRWQDRVGWAITEKGQNLPSVQVEHYPQFEKRPWMIQRMPVHLLVPYHWQGVERLLGGSNESNKLMEAYLGNTDDGKPVKSFLDTYWFDFGDAFHRKYLRQIKVLGRGQFYVTVREDYIGQTSKTFFVDLSAAHPEIWSASGDTWGGGAPGDTWGPVETTQESNTIHPDMYARFFSLRFADASPETSSDTKRLGSRSYTAPRGNWAVLGVLADGWQMGEII